MNVLSWVLVLPKEEPWIWKLIFWGIDPQSGGLCCCIFRLWGCWHPQLGHTPAQVLSFDQFPKTGGQLCSSNSWVSYQRSEASCVTHIVSPGFRHVLASFRTKPCSPSRCAPAFYEDGRSSGRWDGQFAPKLVMFDQWTLADFFRKGLVSQKIHERNVFTSRFMAQAVRPNVRPWNDVSGISQRTA